MADAVPEIKTNSDFVLTDKTLPFYLVSYDQNGNRIAEVGLDSFPQHLTLPFPERMQEIYGYQITRSNLSAKTVKNEITNLADIVQQLGQTEVANQIKKRISINDLLEKNRIIYYDSHTHKVESTDITVGTLTSVQSGITEVYKNYNLPLLDIHSHPVSAMPSAADYNIIVKTFGAEDRICRGIVVLNPDHQLLVIASKDTPKFPFGTWEQADKYLDSLRTSPQLEEIDKEARKLVNEQYATLRKRLRFVPKFIRNTYYNHELEKMQKMSNAKTKNTDHPVAQIYNQNSIAIAKTLGVAIYFSTNCSDFVKWSA